MNKKKIVSALTAIMLCAAGAMSGLTAQAEYLIDPDGSHYGHANVVVDTAASENLTNHFMLYDIVVVYATAKEGYVVYVNPVYASRSFLGESEAVAGDVLEFHNFMVEESRPGRYVLDPDSAEEAYVENLGRYDELLHTEELVLTERTEVGDELDSYVSLTFESEEGKTYTFAEQPGFCIDGLEPGATVKAITYLDTAVPMEVLAAQPLPAGDPDEDGAVNSKDASAVLRTASQIGAKNKPSLNLAQRKACDVNGDGVVNANDASDILRYAAYIGAKNPYMSIPDFLAK